MAPKICNIDGIDETLSDYHSLCWCDREGCSYRASVHRQEHHVWILDQLLHASSEPRASRPIDHSMICTNAEVYHVCFLQAEAIRLAIIIDEFGDSVRLSNCYDGSLRPQNSGHEVATSDVAHA